MNIHELNTKAITSPAWVGLDDGEDTYKLDLNATLSTIQTGVSSAETDATDALDRATTLQSQMATAQGDIAHNQDDIADLQSDLSSLDTRTTASLNNLQSEVDAVEEDVADLKSELNYVGETIAENLGSVRSVVEQGSVNTNTGAISENANYIRTSLISINPSAQYTIAVTNTGSKRLSCVAVYYGADSNRVSNVTIGWCNVGDSTFTVTVPATAYYMRLRFSYYPVATLTPSAINLSVTYTNSWKNTIDGRITTLKSNVIFSYATITTSGLNLNSGDFIHPGTWVVNDTQYMPYNSPTNKRCRIISFASASDNTIYTYQLVIDADGIKYERFSTNTSVWSPWVCDNPYNKLSYKPSDPVCEFEASKHTQAETENYTIIWNSYSDRVNRLIGMYDAEANPNGYTIDKSSLGMDATNTFNVWLYKVSLGYTNQSTKPVVLLIVGEHGNEPASAMTGYYAYKEILNGALSKYLTYVDFWIVPLMNPYGYENNTRNNGNDVNLNRDFPAQWNYARDGHNDTGDYAMSQPETNYILNLCLQNKNRLLFVCNKHDTGAIGRKIAQNEVDTVGYLTTCLYTDSVINEGICQYEDQQVKETDPYIVTACTADISKKQLIVNNSPHPLDGSLDLFLNTIGIHASLLEGSYGWNDGTNVYYDATEYTNPNYATSQIRYITDFLVNYLAWTIQHSEYLQSSDRAFDAYALKSRKYNASTGEWENITLWYNGTSIVEVP